jgi:dimethylaniline monooxygenase (N-oxide forming)
VVIFEQASDVGGIWAAENATSALQLNSILYRFHPAIFWSRGFPRRDEIISQIRKVWQRYHLQDCTRFNYTVTSVTRHALSQAPEEHGHARWVINDGREGIFDAVICSIGTCGPPRKTTFPGQERFKGRVVHSSELDSLTREDVEGKVVAVVGSGASGVEAAEHAVVNQASKTIVLARTDKWIIPRETLADVALSLQPFGRQMPLSFIPQWLVKTFHYRSLSDLAPAKTGIFQATPVVNSDFLNHIRSGKVDYIRGSTTEIAADGVIYQKQTAEGKQTGQAFARADM